MKLRNLFEARAQSVGIIFGRFNPPHKGHRKAWEMASENDAWYVGTNQSTQGPKDPLPYGVKIEAMRMIYPDIEGHIMPEQSWLTMASRIYEKYGDILLRVYTDEEWVVKTIVQYNGKEGPHGFYNFKNIDPVGTPRLSSATELRNAVAADDRAAFSQAAGIDADTPLGKNSFFDVVKHYLTQQTAKPAKKEKAMKVKEYKGATDQERINAFKQQAKDMRDKGFARAADDTEKVAKTIYKPKEKVKAKADEGRFDRGRDDQFSLGGRLERDNDFRNRERNVGVEHEKNNYQVSINGKPWKVFADQRQAMNIARSLRMKGKEVEVYPTGANPSESVAEAAKKPNATTRHLRDYPVSDKDVAKPVKKPEKKKPEQGVAEGIMKSLAIKLLDKKTPQEVANSAISAINKKASGTKMDGHPNFVDFKREVHRYVSAADSGSEAVRRSSDDHVKSLFKKYFSEGVAEGSGKNVVKSVKVGNFRHDLVDTGFGWQVRIYNGDELYDTGLSKNSEQKGLAALDDAVAYTKKQLNIKEQGVAEGSLETDNMVSHIGQVIQGIYPRGGDKKTYMKLVAQEMPRIVKANPKLFRRAFGMAYDRFFHIDQDDDFDYTDYSMRQGERGMEEERKTMSRHAKGIKKYGKDGMAALRDKALDGASEKEMDATRDEYNKYNESSKRCPQCGSTNCTCAPGKCDCKPVKGWLANKEVDEAKDTKVPQKPRQGPLRPQTGAGRHQDKKKDMKQGKEKHKKPLAEAIMDSMLSELDKPSGKLYIVIKGDPTGAVRMFGAFANSPEEVEFIAQRRGTKDKSGAKMKGLKVDLMFLDAADAMMDLKRIFKDIDFVGAEAAEFVFKNSAMNNDEVDPRVQEELKDFMEYVESGDDPRMAIYQEKEVGNEPDRVAKGVDHFVVGPDGKRRRVPIPGKPNSQMGGHAVEQPDTYKYVLKQPNLANALRSMGFNFDGNKIIIPQDKRKMLQAKFAEKNIPWDSVFGAKEMFKESR